MPDYPIQISKVQAPPLRDETLARDRLLDWLSIKIHRRAVLLTAEAGYGKTTLLADFTRRTRIRILWFRLDRGDRDWVGFIAYLVAAIRIHVPDFGAATRSLLRETATTAPTLETVLETFIRELTAVPIEPTALVFDDFHLVDDAGDIRHVVRELLTRGPERMSFVFASRREPPIRLARLRALGEVAELGTDDLRFDAAETERLFRETYEMRLEPSLLAELRRRTEGWAASLQLVRAALHDRDPGEVRTFISSLSGAEGHLYEYLAEEVIGELPDELQRFLMRTSVLETVDLTLGPVAAGVSIEEATRLIEAGERHGLLGRGGPRAKHIVRAHPLVRDFLAARLVRSAGIHHLRELHSKVAAAAERINWRIATQHYLAAGNEGDAARTLASALETILATGAYAAAEELSIALSAGHLPGAAGLVLRSRIALQRADAAEGLALAEEARKADVDSTLALLNLVSARTLAGDIAGALEANRLLAETGHSALADIGRAYERTMSASLAGSIDSAANELAALAASFRRQAQHHFLGVTLLNLAMVHMARGAAEVAHDAAAEAIDVLTETSAGVELVAARLARAQALAMLGQIDGARADIRVAAERARAGQTIEVALEAGQIEALYGESSRARHLIELATKTLPDAHDETEQALLSRALVRIGDGDIDAAGSDAHRLQFGQPTTSMAFEARRHLLLGLVGMLSGDTGAKDAIRAGTDLANRQGAALWAWYGECLEVLADQSQDPTPALQLASTRSPIVLGMLAEPIASRLGDLGDEGVAVVEHAARRTPWRWRMPLRRALERQDGRLAAAAILEQVGDASDVARLRDAARRIKGRLGVRLGYQLARRLAPRVFVEDLGRVRILRSGIAVEGSEVRRKVLALLCLLLTRPRFALARDEVLDSLWPDHDPASALNSLNQTVYFLRRVFEPQYVEDLSPGYVGQDAETVWLDTELVDCASQRCLDMIRNLSSEPSPESVLALAEQYRGRFALDFSYEEWAAPYRDSLHAGYLRVIERAIRLDINQGQLHRATYLAERAADVDPDSEEMQLALTRLYRQAGTHAAAAEQYAHYAQLVTDLGLEPIPFSDV